jgi:DNA-binding HxlR family transcriptional regulator
MTSEVATLRPQRARARIDDLEMIALTRRALELVQPKWAVDLVFLMASGIRRHARLVDNVPGISKKVLTATLRSLERDGIAVRRVYDEMPVRVDYSLTPLGWRLTEMLMAVHEWASEHLESVEGARAAYDHRRGGGTRDLAA